jgi:hypothetical protein
MLLCFNSVDVFSHAGLLKYTYIGMAMTKLNHLIMSKIKITLNSRNASCLSDRNTILSYSVAYELTHSLTHSWS